MAWGIFVQQEARRSLVALATRASTQRNAEQKGPAKTERYLVYNALCVSSAIRVKVVERAGQAPQQRFRNRQVALRGPDRGQRAADGVTCRGAQDRGHGLSAH